MCIRDSGCSNATIVKAIRDNEIYSSGAEEREGRITDVTIELNDNSGVYVFEMCIRDRNGSQLDLEQNPIMVNDSVLLPIRAVAESMSAEVTWTEGVRKIGNVVGIQKDSRYIGFCVEDTGYNENYNPYHMMIRDGDQEGRFVKLYAPVTLYNGYTMRCV